MKTKMGVCLALVLCATAAFAEWKMDFPEQYRKEGIDKAVIAAIEQGALPVDIVENGLQLEGLNPQNLVNGPVLRRGQRQGHYRGCPAA